MAQDPIIPPMNIAPEELAKLLLQPPKAQESVDKPTGDSDTWFGLLRVASASGPHATSLWGQEAETLFSHID